MTDTLGGRVILYFLRNVTLIDAELATLERFEISEDHPPVAYLGNELCTKLGLRHLRHVDKESGYNSVHYIVRLRDSSVPRDRRPWFELQVRTLAQDLWAEIEHVLGYKPQKRTSFAVRKQFQLLSGHISTIDEHFNFLYEELLRFQEEVTYKDTDPLNAENIPPVLSELGLGCAQREINGLIKLLVSRGVTTVGRLREVASAPILETIRNSYVAHKKRQPKNFEVIATLATVHSAKDQAQVNSLIEAHINFLDAWDRLKDATREDTRTSSAGAT